MCEVERNLIKIPQYLLETVINVAIHCRSFTGANLKWVSNRSNSSFLYKHILNQGIWISRVVSYGADHRFRISVFHSRASTRVWYLSHQGEIKILVITRRRFSITIHIHALHFMSTSHLGTCTLVLYSE